MAKHAGPGSQQSSEPSATNLACLPRNSYRRAVVVWWLWRDRSQSILAKHETDATLPEIGRYFGGMHHTTVMHAIAKMDELRRTDFAIELAITKLLKTLGVE